MTIHNAYWDASMPMCAHEGYANQADGLADHVEVAVGHRVERPRVERDPHHAPLYLGAAAPASGSLARQIRHDPAADKGGRRQGGRRQG